MSINRRFSVGRRYQGNFAGVHVQSGAIGNTDNDERGSPLSRGFLVQGIGQSSRAGPSVRTGGAVRVRLETTVDSSW